MLHVEVKLPHTITPQMIADWVTTAYEGGIGYWCGRQEYVTHELYHKLSSDDAYSMPVYALPEYWGSGGKTRLFDGETGKPFDKELSMVSICDALPKLRKDVIEHLLDDSRFDADDADILVQMVLFGEIVYG